MTTDPDFEPTEGQRQRVLWLSTVAFTLMFAVWLMFGMLAVRFKPELGLSDGQLYNLTLVAILAGSLPRFHFGVWTDRYGGRVVLPLLLLLVVVPTALVSRATTYTHLLVLAGLFGLAGNAFSVGIAWCAAWFPKERQGLALGIFGAGNVGASAHQAVRPVPDRAGAGQRVPGRRDSGRVAVHPGRVRGAAGADGGGRPVPRPEGRPDAGEGEDVRRGGAAGRHGEGVGVQPALRRGVRRVRRPVEPAAPATTWPITAASWPGNWPCTRRWPRTSRR